jgi:hypothetical protein
VDNSESNAPEASDRVRELEGEVAKFKRMAERNAKKAERPAQNDEPGLIEKGFLRSAGISKEDEVELALTTAKKWGMSVDKLVDDEDFQGKLDKHRTAKANAAATSNIRGNKTGSTAKETAEYWIAKGAPPTAADVPDRTTRAKIVRSMMGHEKGSGNPFYNG